MKNGEATLNNVKWTVNSSSTYWGWDANKGIQLGSGNVPAKTVTISTDELVNFNKIVINASTAKSASATIEVLVNGVSIASKSLTTTATDYIFDLSEITSGTIEIKITQTTSKALYIKSIAVSEV